MGTGRQVLRRLVTEAGGVSAFARQLGVTREPVYRWLRSGKLPMRRVEQVVKQSRGAVSASELRPDLAEMFR